MCEENCPLDSTILHIGKRNISRMKNSIKVCLVYSDFVDQDLCHTKKK